jgi:hypothetical protein
VWLHSSRQIPQLPACLPHFSLLETGETYHSKLCVQQRPHRLQILSFPTNSHHLRPDSWYRQLKVDRCHPTRLATPVTPSQTSPLWGPSLNAVLDPELPWRLNTERHGEWGIIFHCVRYIWSPPRHCLRSTLAGLHKHLNAVHSRTLMISKNGNTHVRCTSTPINVR